MTDIMLRKKTIETWNFRCALRPWVRTYPYAHIHYTNYHRYGYERIGVDLIPLSPSSHEFIHRLGGAKTVMEQNRWGRYPNLLQRLAHTWCRITMMIIHSLAL